jgi:hypothetical protein
MAGGAKIRSVVDLTPFCCSPKEAAKLTNLSVDVIYNAIKAQELPAFEMVVNGKRVNRRLLKLVDLLDWINDYSVAFCGSRVGDKVEGVAPRDRVHEPTTKRGIRKARKEANKEDWRELQSKTQQEFLETIRRLREGDRLSSHE